MRQESKPQAGRYRIDPIAAVIIGIFLAGLLILIFQHWMHVWAWLPYVLLAACPLAMLFMMRDMHGRSF